ncbi:MAG: ABC transporter permease [Candidatus Limnocylindrales bacterium]
MSATGAPTAGADLPGRSTEATQLWRRLARSERLALACAVAAVLGFFALPWLSEGSVEVSAIGLLVNGARGLSPELALVVDGLRWQLVLIPTGLAITLIALWLRAGAAITLSYTRARWVARMVPIGGLVAFTWFVLYILEDRDSPVFLMAVGGTGFWIAAFATALIVIGYLVAAPRPLPSALATDARTGGRYRGTIRRFLDDPRVDRLVALAFRFQSFFGLVIVIVLAIIFSPTRDGDILFLGQRNLSNVTRDVAETGVLAVGMLLVIIIGGIDLSVGAVVALAATGVAFLLMRDLMPAIPAITIILGMGLLIGWWNGWMSERFRIPSFITTLAMLSIARGLAHIWSSDIAVPISYGSGGADPVFEIIGERINGVFPVPAIIMFGVAIVMGLILRYTAFGRHLYAIGGNQTAARLSGLAVSRTKIAAFMLCSFFACLAGIMHAAQLNQGSPNEAVGYELNAIAAVVIGGASLAGGRGTVAGAIAGAFILGILDNMLSLNNVNSNMQLVTKGLLVVGAVALQQVRPRNVEA